MSRVLVTLDPGPGERDLVEAILPEAVWLGDGPLGPDVMREIEAAVVFWPRRELRAAGLAWEDLPSLRVIQAATAGVNHIGWDAIPEGVRVAAAPGSNAPYVAEYVLAVVLEWARGLRRHTEAVRRGTWDMGAPVKAMRELRIGLLGYGGIGRETATMVGALGARVRAINRSGTTTPEGARVLDRPVAIANADAVRELATWADVLVVCLPLVKGTWGLVGEEGLDALGDDALLVNVARGPIVDEAALYAWLADDNGKGRAAALDVWWHYPKEQGRPFHESFHELDNVVMTPHHAPNVAGFRNDMIGQACRQLRRFLDGGPLEAEQPRGLYQSGADGRGDGDGR